MGITYSEGTICKKWVKDHFETIDGHHRYRILTGFFTNKVEIIVATRNKRKYQASVSRHTNIVGIFILKTKAANHLVVFLGYGHDKRLLNSSSSSTDRVILGVAATPSMKNFAST